MNAPTVDIEQLRRDHGRAQAAFETRLRDSVGDRYATASLVQGCRLTWWEAIKYALEMQADVDNLSAEEVVAELRKREGSIYWPVLMNDPRCWVICDRCDHRVLIDAGGICPECNYDFDFHL